ncbi:MAG: hypothetical protein HN389_12665 [Clostridia bacterium]|nr:hypothetical protein [Clostridia bacterium]
MKYLILSVLIFVFLFGATSCAKEPAKESLVLEDFYYDEIKEPFLSQEEQKIYKINLERLFSHVPAEKLFEDEITYFDSDLYGEDYRSDYLGNVDQIIDSPELAVRQHLVFHMGQSDQSYRLQRPYLVQYDDAKDIWLITASPDYLVGRKGSGISFMIAGNGDILGVWEYLGFFEEEEDGYFSILNYDDIIWDDRFLVSDTNPVEINTAKEAAMKFEEIWGESVIEQRPYIVSFDPVAQYWMVEGNTDYLEGALGGNAIAIFSKDGKGEMYVLHTE